MFEKKANIRNEVNEILFNFIVKYSHVFLDKNKTSGDMEEELSKTSMLYNDYIKTYCQNRYSKPIEYKIPKYDYLKTIVDILKNNNVKILNVIYIDNYNHMNKKKEIRNELYLSTHQSKKGTVKDSIIMKAKHEYCWQYCFILELETSTNIKFSLLLDMKHGAIIPLFSFRSCMNNILRWHKLPTVSDSSIGETILNENTKTKISLSNDILAESQLKLRDCYDVTKNRDLAFLSAYFDSNDDIKYDLLIENINPKNNVIDFTVTHKTYPDIIMYFKYYDNAKKIKYHSSNYPVTFLKYNAERYFDMLNSIESLLDLKSKEIPDFTNKSYLKNWTHKRIYEYFYMSIFKKYLEFIFSSDAMKERIKNYTIIEKPEKSELNVETLKKLDSITSFKEFLGLVYTLMPDNVYNTLKDKINMTEFKESEFYDHIEKQNS